MIAVTVIIFGLTRSTAPDMIAARRSSTDGGEPSSRPGRLVGRIEGVCRLMTFHDEYKPFRNYMQRFALLEGLVDVWRYSLHVMEGQPLPPGYAAGKERLTPRPVAELVYPWHLDILARELVLNARHTGGRSLKRWNDLAVAGNHIRRLDDAAFTSGSGQPDVLLELHRMAHRQFPWQSDVGFAPLVRAFKVFGNAAVDGLALRELGMTMRQFLLLGAAVAGHFLRDWG